MVEIETALLAKNAHLAEHNRAWLAERGIVALNLMSSPGSGKTSLLERTIAETSGRREVCVIEGDQETAADAERIARACLADSRVRLARVRVEKLDVFPDAVSAGVEVERTRG